MFFYRSPYDGRVFFDELGPPWPKHPCTDNSEYIRRTTRQSVPQDVPLPRPAWYADGWQPLLSSRIYSDKERLLVTGDGPNKFIELHFQRGSSVDRDSPVQCVRLPKNPEYLRLHSCARMVSPRTEAKPSLLTRGSRLLARRRFYAVANDPCALYELGLYLLDSFAEPDIARARIYLEAAAGLGHVEAYIELAVIALFAIEDA